ncbi:MAG: V-type ATP synthase subunit B [Candidatus Lokiarchaeota archaeon]|nr:V-type ATP synthase subunit B [Candidatus Lokiarchaeota archaeon]
MKITYSNIQGIEGPLVFLRHQHNVMNGEIVHIIDPNGIARTGRVLEISENVTVIEVFQGTAGLDTDRTQLTFSDEVFQISISRDMLGRTFDGQGRPKILKNADSFPELLPEVVRPICGTPINPYSRSYPTDVIHTGISVIDGLTTLVRGQKLPIFTGQGLSHNKLAAQIVKQAKVREENFVVVFVGIGILQDDAMYFEQRFKESGNWQNVISFLNIASDPTIERILIPRIALTVAEYFAFDLDMHVLVIMTDITNYCEALRELSSAKGEIPSRKGFPGYMYSDLASLYERAGKIKGREGSITQIPIITMPNDDITHPIPDLTGFITEGQIVLSRELYKRNVYPPIDILSSLSRLMKEGVGEGKTREDHSEIASQLYSLYAQSLEIKELESIIGEESLTSLDKRILNFGKSFEQYFMNQKFDEERDVITTLDLAWDLVSTVPKRNILRISPEILDKYYIEDARIKEKLWGR